MIHDATVEVTCDDCGDSTYVEPKYVYTNYSGNNGHYDTDDESIEEILEKEHDFLIKDGNHYCNACRDDHEEE